jgi:hypothetical protein
MNRTYMLGFMPECSEDKQNAQKYLESKYSGIKYNEISDDYEYRGVNFDYFKCGTGYGKKR